MTGISDAAAQRETRKYPKLVLLIAVDQFRYDYLTRFREHYTAGLNRLLTKGAVFTNANLEHYPTVTAVGHATMLSGATPALSGIMGNDWYDRESRQQVTSVSDESVKLLGGSVGLGSSPRRLLVSTLGDEMKMAGRGTPRVVGMSLKDRSAILPAGHMADGAYWYDANTGTFVSSTYYFADLPAWVKEFNSRRLPDKYAGAEWNTVDAEQGGTLKLPSETGPKLYEAVYSSPFGNELLASFAEQGLRAERLGQRGATDLLSVSFSSNDAVGHEVGPDAPQVRDISIRTDRVLGKLFDAIDHLLGLDNVVVVLTADHGVLTLPEKLAERKMPGGRMKASTLWDPIQAALKERYGEGKWIELTAGTSPYFNLDLIREKKLDFTEFQQVAARAAASVPHVLRVYTRDQLLLGQAYPDRIGARVLRSFNLRRSGDLEIIFEPYWIRSTSGTTHGTPYSYDTHIPLIFMGPGIKPGKYTQNVALNDLAPTLASILDLEPPSGSVGRVLHEIFAVQ
ncbi:MAG TPA: alkaline phosphatase family protein [Anaerolineales bacterium]